MRETKRLCIYLLADRDGIVDEYICYMLQKIQDTVNDIVVVSNGNLTKESKTKLEMFTRDIYIRKNEGFDAGGFKDTILNYLSIERVQEYEELVLINDSFFGPIDSFTHVFSEMDKREEVDLWSLTKNMGNYETKPSMQTYFVVFKSNLLHSKTFVEYWETLPYYTQFIEAVEQYEKNFADYFERRGYVWDAYINDDKYDCEESREFYFSSYHSEQYELMKEQKYPVVKRKLFAFNAMEGDYGIERQGRENILDTLKYIDTNTDYDSAMIWQHILRVYDLRNIQDSCCLRYIPTEKAKKANKSVFCIWYNSDIDSFQMRERLSDLLMKTEVYLLTNTERTLDYLSKYTNVNLLVVDKQENKWTALTQLIDKLSEFDYIGVLSEEELGASANEPYSVKAGASWTKWENLISGDDYISKVAALFENNKSLGLLVSQKPVFAKYFACEGFSEKIEYQQEDFFYLANIFKLNFLLRQNSELADYSDSFWCRRDQMIEFLQLIQNCHNKKLVRNNSKLIDKLFPYFIQSRRYYTAVLESEKSASVTETLCIDYLRDIVKCNKANYIFSTYPEMKSHMGNPIKNVGDIREFIRTHKKVGIYGTGKIARQLVLLNNIGDFDCFVVSDGEKKSTLVKGKKVYWLSEIKDKAMDGIIIALNKNNTYKALMGLGKVDFEKDIIFVER